MIEKVFPLLWKNLGRSMTINILSDVGRLSYFCLKLVKRIFYSNASVLCTPEYSMNVDPLEDEHVDGRIESFFLE